MPRIAVFGGTGYLASLIKAQNKIKKNKFIFFSRKKTSKNFINYNLIDSKKYFSFWKNIDVIIHLAGPNQKKLNKNKNLIKKRNLLTSKICDLCLINNIKLIYISSMQIYKDYGKKNLSINSKNNLINPYSKSHYDSEQIIKKKFFNQKKIFMILRMGNVFGFKKNINPRMIAENLVHNLCSEAIIKKKILIDKGFIQRTFVPSEIFVKIINLIISKKIFENSIANISYKILSLKDIAKIIQKRLNLRLNIHTNIVVKNISNKKKYLISLNKNLSFKVSNKTIYNEIDQILEFLNKNLRKKNSF